MPVPQKQTINIETGEVTWVDLTAEEIAQRTADEAAAISDAANEMASATERTAATSDLKAQYQAAIARLDQIINAASPTNAQVIAAVRDLATIERRMLRYLGSALG